MTEPTKCWEPLTKVARELACDCARHFVGKWMPGPFDAETIYRYEATVVEAEERVKTLEALAEEQERLITELQAPAYIGRIVLGMPEAAPSGLALETPHRCRNTWRLWGQCLGVRPRVLVMEDETLEGLFAKIEAEGRGGPTG